MSVLRTTVLLLTSWCALPCSFCQTASKQQATAEDIIRGMERTILEHQNVSYRAILEMKFSNMPDTFHHEESVMMERVASDTSFGGRIRFSTGEKTFSAYNPGYCYTCDLSTDSCERYDLKKRYDWPINSDTRTMIRWLDFQKPERVKGNFAAGTRLDLFNDTLIEGTSCWHVRAHYANKGDVTNNIKDLYISQDDRVPVLEVWHLLAEGDLQYSSRLIKDVRFDALTEHDLDIAKIMPKAVITDYELTENEPVLAVGEKAPPLVGDIHGSAVGVDTIPYGGKVTMVDFWYMSCPPCRSSIPVLDSLYLAYKDRGVQFVGVNHWDYKTGRLDQLPAFLEKRPIHYPILLSEIEMEEAFKVHAHPAFFIVDRTGNIAYTNEGYGPGTGAKWAEKIEELLR